MTLEILPLAICSNVYNRLQIPLTIFRFIQLHTKMKTLASECLVARNLNSLQVAVIPLLNFQNLSLRQHLVQCFGNIGLTSN